MRKLCAFLVCACLASAAFAQDKQRLELQNKFWDSGDEKQERTLAPEKWKGESAVVLYLEENYKYTNNGKKMKYPSFWHQRVKLLDKAAVESYSEFSYDKNSGFGSLFRKWDQNKTILGIKVIKPDGTENIVDVKKMKVVQDKEVKIAVPGLEIGDILDIFMYQDDFSLEYYGVHVHDPVEIVLKAKYPIAYRKLSIEVENDYYLNMESYNGAPEIEEVPTEKRATRRYVLEASDIEKSDFPRWFYPLVELPTVKFQVVFALNGRSAEVFLGEDDAVRKTGVSDEEIMEYYGERFDTYNRGDVKDILDYLGEKGITDKREQMVQALYYIRHKSFNRFIELIVSEENKIAGYNYPCDDYIVIQEDNFVNYMAGLAKQLEVDYDIIVATADYNGSIDDLLLRSNVSHGLRFNFDDPLYFFHISPHVQPELFPENLEGTKIYTLSVKKDRKVEEVGTDVLPATTALENVDKKTVKVVFVNGFEKMNVEREMEFSGHFKIHELNERLFFNEFLNEEFERYGTSHFYHCRKRQSNKDEEVEQKMKSFYASLKEKHDERLSERVKMVYDVAEIKDYKYEILDAARYSTGALSVKDNFSIENEFIQRAGPNYLFKAGKFIGSQVQIEKDEEKRVADVNINYAKTYEYQVEITIPEGYEVVGLDKLEKNVSNKTGSFTSTASIENGALKYTARKVYAKPHYEASEWDQMLPWLKAAYDFSQEKVMFKYSGQ